MNNKIVFKVKLRKVCPLEVTNHCHKYIKTNTLYNMTITQKQKHSNQPSFQIPIWNL